MIFYQRFLINPITVSVKQYDITKLVGAVEKLSNHNITREVADSNSLENDKRISFNARII